MRVLLVEDDAMIAQAVSANLKDTGYAVDWVSRGSEVAAAVAAQAYDLLLLDLGLPGKDGLDVLAQIRNGGCTVPVLIVTARDDLHSRLNGLDGGADDYIVKPFDMAELQARMRAVLRRHGGQAQTLLTNGIITLNPSTHQAEVVGQEQAIMLSNKEFAVLQALLLRPGMILSRSDLEDKIYGWGEEVESNAVDFLIHALRKKLGKEAIQNVRGVGWLVAQNTRPSEKPKQHQHTNHATPYPHHQTIPASQDQPRPDLHAPAPLHSCRHIFILRYLSRDPRGSRRSVAPSCELSRPERCR